MPSFETRNFGRVSYEPQTAVQFPRGLPGFENRKRFLALQFDDSKPLVFLQSLDDPALCFITLPVFTIDPAYRLSVEADDRAVLGLPPEQVLTIGRDILCLVIVSVQETGPTANLLAPIVVSLANLQAVQTIQANSGYSHQHSLVPQETVQPETAVC